jgi:hypothetical protein
MQSYCIKQIISKTFLVGQRNFEHLDNFALSLAKQGFKIFLKMIRLQNEDQEYFLRKKTLKKCDD